MRQLWDPVFWLFELLHAQLYTDDKGNVSICVHERCSSQTTTRLPAPGLFCCRGHEEADHDDHRICLS